MLHLLLCSRSSAMLSYIILAMILREEQLLWCGTSVAHPFYRQKRHWDLISLIHGTSSRYDLMVSGLLYWLCRSWLSTSDAVTKIKHQSIKDISLSTTLLTFHNALQTFTWLSERLPQSSSTFVGRLDNSTLSVSLCASVFLSTHLLTIYSLTLSAFPAKINNS